MTLQKRSNVIWSLHASLCRLDGAAVPPADVHAMASVIDAGDMGVPGTSGPESARLRGSVAKVGCGAKTVERYPPG
jgi:hypothetical protein